MRKGGYEVHMPTNHKTAGVVFQLLRYTEACSILWMVQTAEGPFQLDKLLVLRSCLLSESHACESPRALFALKSKMGEGMN